jgi:hypothetical protein
MHCPIHQAALQYGGFKAPRLTADTLGVCAAAICRPRGQRPYLVPGSVAMSAVPRGHGGLLGMKTPKSV